MVTHVLGESEITTQPFKKCCEVPMFSTKKSHWPTQGNRNIVNCYGSTIDSPGKYVALEDKML